MQTSKETSASSTAQENANDSKEWEEARAVLAKFDERIHDLRKVGFSFVTALLTAQTLLVSGSLSVGNFVPGLVKLTVLWVTFILIAGLRLAETNYRFYLQAAAMRARIIEKRLNMDLTDAISYFYQKNSIWAYIDGIYVALVIATGALGISVLVPDYPLVAVQAGATLTTLIIVNWIGGLSRPIDPEKDPLVDWNVTPLICSSGDSIRITVTNLHETNVFRIPAGDIPWQIERPDGTFVGPQEGAKARSEIIVGPKEANYDWLWNTKGVEDGIYQLHPYRRRPLRRRIWIKPKETSRPDDKDQRTPK